MKWTRFDRHEYRATSGAWTFCASGKGKDWILRGWQGEKFEVHRSGTSLRSLKVWVQTFMEAGA